MCCDRGPPDRDYVSYLLRLWREDLNGRSSWRATLQDVQTSQEHYFADVGALLELLAARFSSGSANPCARQKPASSKDKTPKEVPDDSS